MFRGDTRDFRHRGRASPAAFSQVLGTHVSGAPQDSPSACRTCSVACLPSFAAIRRVIQTVPLQLPLQNLRFLPIRRGSGRVEDVPDTGDGLACEPRFFDTSMPRRPSPMRCYRCCLRPIFERRHAVTIVVSMPDRCSRARPSEWFVYCLAAPVPSLRVNVVACHFHTPNSRRLSYRQLALSTLICKYCPHRTGGSGPSTCCGS